MIRVGLFIVLVAIGAALVGPALTPYDPASQELARRLEGPSFAHPLGLDELGRDILARLLAGARVSLLVGLAVVSVSSTVGMLMGSVAGYFGGRVDDLISRVIDGGGRRTRGLGIQCSSGQRQHVIDNSAHHARGCVPEECFRARCAQAR